MIMEVNVKMQELVRFYLYNTDIIYNLFQLCYVVIKKNRLDIDISNLKISFQKFS